MSDNIMRLGVDWETQDNNTLNSILKDALLYKSVADSKRTNLVLVCKEPKFLSNLCRVVPGLSCEKTGKSECSVWKLYYYKEIPKIPEGATTVYSKRIRDLSVKRNVLRQGIDTSPSLYNPSDHIMVPPGNSPNINKIPPRHHTQYPQTYMPFF